MAGLSVCAIALTPRVAAQTKAKDFKGSADHPLFPNRMPGYSISTYQQKEFDQFAFATKPATRIEGKFTKINYYLQDAGAHPGALASTATIRTPSRPWAARWCTRTAAIA